MYAQLMIQMLMNEVLNRGNPAGLPILRSVLVGYSIKIVILSYKLSIIQVMLSRSLKALKLYNFQQFQFFEKEVLNSIHCHLLDGTSMLNEVCFKYEDLNVF